jgi:DNA-binding LacI/PurR family transcriptional regulator
MNMAVTIKDVAKRANVSPSTVSRAISNYSRISDETKKNVYAAMEYLNYKPNAIARNLASSTTKTLGLIIPNQDENLFKNPFFIQAMRGISIYSQKKNYKIMFNYSSNTDDDLNLIREFVNSKWVDGIILLTAYEDDPCIRFLSQIEFPFVVIGRPENPNEILWVDNDNFQATYQVVSHLIQNGNTKIGFISGPLHYVFSKDRLEGYKKALEIRNMEFNNKLVLNANDFDEEQGYKAMSEICKDIIPQAVVTTDDLLAIGALRYCKENDLQVNITGFNNTVLSRYHNPTLTTVDINAEELGYNAAKLIISKLDGRKSNINHFIVDTSLIKRESTNNRFQYKRSFE